MRRIGRTAGKKRWKVRKELVKGKKSLGAERDGSRKKVFSVFHELNLVPEGLVFRGKLNLNSRVRDSFRVQDHFSFAGS